MNSLNMQAIHLSKLLIGPRQHSTIHQKNSPHKLKINHMPTCSPLLMVLFRWKYVSALVSTFNCLAQISWLHPAVTDVCIVRGFLIPCSDPVASIFLPQLGVLSEKASSRKGGPKPANDRPLLKC
jgi:hypothetical protein